MIQFMHVKQDAFYFGKELVDETHCPKCNLSRYVDGSSTIPRKVLRHFPIIPRLKLNVSLLQHCSTYAVVFCK